MKQILERWTCFRPQQRIFSYKAVTSPLSFLGKENTAVITENNQKAVLLYAMMALRGRGDLAVSLSLSLSLLTSALDRGEWPASRPCRALPRGKTPVPIVQEAGWVLEPVWTQRLEEKFFVPAGDRTPIAVRSQTLRVYLLSYPGSTENNHHHHYFLYEVQICLLGCTAV
jgi:hypothetical protein